MKTNALIWNIFIWGIILYGIFFHGASLWFILLGMLLTYDEDKKEE